MVTLAKTVDGLLYKMETSGAITGWTGDTSQWVSTSRAGFSVFAPLPIALLGPSLDETERDGIREGQVYVENGIWYLYYDAGDHVHGWLSRYAISTDRGLSWLRKGSMNDGYTKISGGSWQGTAMGWVEKRGSTYYRHRVLATTDVGTPNNGLTGQPYYGDTWSTSSLTGTWTSVNSIPLGSVGTWCYDEALPGSVVYDSGSSTYYMLVEGSQSAGNYQAGIYSASSPGGPYTPGAVQATSSTTGFGGRIPENAKGFYSDFLSTWVSLINLIAVAGTFTDANAYGTSSSVSDWSTATWRRVQRVSPESPNAIGVPCHLTGPDGELITDATGIVPFTFDSLPQRYTPGWHIGRSIQTGALEPSTHCLLISQSANTTVYRITRTLSHTDAVIEMAVCPTAVHGGGMGFRVEMRSDSTGANCYRFVLNAAGSFLEKVVSGTPSTVATTSGTLGYETYLNSHLKFSLIGTTLKGWLDGELAFSVTDATFGSGTNIGISCQGGTAEVRSLSVRTSDTVTVAGLNPTTSCIVRGYGSFPAGSITSNSSGSGTFTHSHYPLAFLEFDGTDYTPLGGIWGGDTLTFSNVPAATIGTGLRAIGR